MNKFPLHKKRKKYLVKKSLQINLILRSLALLILACLIMVMSVFMLTKKSTTANFENLRLTVKSTPQFILPALIISGLISMAVAGAAAISVLLFVSHKIAGPLHRIEISLSEIGKGDLSSEIRLRKSDGVKTLAAGINNMKHKLKDPIQLSQVKIKELEEEITAVKSALTAKGIHEEEAGHILWSIQKKIRDIKHHLSYFKIMAIAAAFLALSSSTPAQAGGPEEIASPSINWITKKSVFCAINFRHDVNIPLVNEKIDTYGIDYGLMEKPPRPGRDDKEQLAYKFDLIFLKVQEILDMRPKGLSLNVNIYHSRQDLDKVYMAIFNEKNEFITYYIFKLNTLYSEENAVSANIIAHEIAHCVVDHYFSVTPPTKIAEMIAQYADAHLRN
ncbi:MAG: HAMP domain-containing protein [Candidatus Omnitrophota bacterium]